MKLITLLLIITTGCASQKKDSEQIIGKWCEQPDKTYIKNGDTVKYPILIPPLPNSSSNDKNAIIYDHFLTFNQDGTVHQSTTDIGIFASGEYSITEGFLIREGGKNEIVMLNDSVLILKDEAAFVDYVLTKFNKIKN